VILAPEYDYSKKKNYKLNEFIMRRITSI